MDRSVDKTAATVDEAIAAALSMLGVDRSRAQVEVLVHPRRGLLGRTRPARVRVTALEEPPQDPAAAQSRTPGSIETAPTTTEVSTEASTQEDGVTDTSTNDQNDQGEPVEQEMAEPEAADPEAAEPEAGDSEAAEPEEELLTPEERLDQLDQEAEIAADFLEGMLDLLNLPGDIEIHVREEQAIVNVSDVGSGLLIGRRGATLDALQELVRCATQRQTERRSHVRVDVEGYRERQLDKLYDKCRDAIAEVRETQEPVRLEPMDPYERKMMHDLVSQSGGVTSTSEGSEPRRRVVIHPTE